MTDWDDTDYSSMAADYAAVRRPDPRIAAQLAAAIGAARTVLNLGAGTGSYEPTDRHFDDDTFDAALAVFTIHHWPDLDRGLAEVRRVTRGPVVMMTADPEALSDLWLAAYAPEFHTTERARYPGLGHIATALGTEIALDRPGDAAPTAAGRRGDERTPRPLEIRPLRIPLDCSDGFADAFYGRPEALLDPAVRNAQSAWSFVDDDAQARFARRLRADLDSGAWDERHGHLRTQPEFEGSIRILTA